MTIEAKVVAHSSHPNSPDLITLQLRYPRFIHAEFMTHRVFSRNASSSRAVPVNKMIEDVLDDPAIPSEWGSNQPGMQAGVEVKDAGQAKEIWLAARDAAVNYAKEAAGVGLHKQVVNRLLEPFSHISVVCTATDWDGFFTLRDHPDADPTIRELAVAMKAAIAASKPVALLEGEWHVPYADFVLPVSGTARVDCSAARCARVSYLNHDGSGPLPIKDFRLKNRLLADRHMSPFEHQATPRPGERHANLNGWKSYRSVLEESK